MRAGDHGASFFSEIDAGREYDRSLICMVGQFEIRTLGHSDYC